MTMVVLAALLVGCEKSESDAADSGRHDAGEVPEDGGDLPSCSETQAPEGGACAGFTGSPVEQPSSFAGVVQAIERPETLACDAAGRGPIDNASQQGYEITIAGDDLTMRVSVHVPWRKPFVNVGDAVGVENLVSSSVDSPTPSSLTLRDEEGALLFWQGVAFGFDDFELSELSFRDGGATCHVRDSCEGHVRGDLIAASDQSAAIRIAAGESADVGDYVVLNVDNSSYPLDCMGWTDRSINVVAIRGSASALSED